VRKRIKNVNIRIRPDGSIFVSAPSAVPFYHIEEILRARQDFILRAVENSLAREREKRDSYACDEGASVSLFGREYTVHIQDRGTSRIEGDELFLVLKKTEDPDKRKDALKRFAEKELRAYAMEVFARVHSLFFG
jgi:predicted metal-dependent hydrolase